MINHNRGPLGRFGCGYSSYGRLISTTPIIVVITKLNTYSKRQGIKVAVTNLKRWFWDYGFLF